MSDNPIIQDSKSARKSSRATSIPSDDPIRPTEHNHERERSKSPKSWLARTFRSKSTSGPSSNNNPSSSGRRRSSAAVAAAPENDDTSSLAPLVNASDHNADSAALRDLGAHDRDTYTRLMDKARTMDPDEFRAYIAQFKTQQEKAERDAGGPGLSGTGGQWYLFGTKERRLD